MRFRITEFPSRLRRARKSKGISQDRLGEIVGIAGCQICFYETGRNMPRIECLVAIAQALNTDIRWLLGHEQ